jgi:hypothetical protein
MPRLHKALFVGSNNLATLQNIKQTLQKLIFFLIATFFYKLSFSQADIVMADTTKSVYKNLTIRKFYSLGYSTSSRDNITTYKINDKEVDKGTYDKYHSTWKNMETCKPCILLTYDYNDKLLTKGIQYTDCIVGFWIEYFPSGKVKLIGHYKENVTGNWDSAYDKGFCRPDGIWSYFSEQSKKLYSEIWKDGQFVKQVPEQSKTELWTVEITHNGVEVNNQTLSPKQVSEIKIIPKFKNSKRTGTNLTVKFEIATTGHKIINQTFPLSDFAKINVQKMLLESGVTKTETASCSIMVFNNGDNVSNARLNVKE